LFSSRGPSPWEEIKPEIAAGKKVLIAAHGNSLRALVKHLDNISKEDIVSLNIPTGIPLVYELDENRLLKKTTHADQAAYVNDHWVLSNVTSIIAGFSRKNTPKIFLLRTPINDTPNDRLESLRWNVTIPIYMFRQVCTCVRKNVSRNI